MTEDEKRIEFVKSHEGWSKKYERVKARVNNYVFNEVGRLVHVPADALTLAQFAEQHRGTIDVSRKIMAERAELFRCGVHPGPEPKDVVDDYDGPSVVSIDLGLPPRDVE